MTVTKLRVSLIDKDDKEFVHVVERDLQPGVHHMIDQVRSMAEEAMAAWDGKPEDRATLAVNCIAKLGETRPFTIDAEYPNGGGEFGDYTEAVDVDDAEFGVRWNMAENDGQRSDLARIDVFTSYMSDVTVREVFHGKREDPTQALHALFTAVSSGDGVEEALERARTTLNQAGFNIEPASPTPGL